MASVRNFAIDGLNALLRNDARLDQQTFKYGLAAIRLDGAAGSYVQSGEAFALGALDWCLEAWVNVDAAQPNAVVRLAQLSTALPDQYGPGHLSLRASGGLAVIAHDFDPATPLISTSEDLIGAGWVHLALSREGSTWRLFRDGVIVGTATWAGTIAGTNPWFLGGHPYTDTAPSGWIDDARLTVGAARYTAAFTPPADQLPTAAVGGGGLVDEFTKLTLPFDDNFDDLSGNESAYTNYGAIIGTTQSRFGAASASFNGSQYIEYTVPGGFGSAEFTLEFWLYASASTGYVFNNRTNGLDGDGIDIRTDLFTTTANRILFSQTTYPNNEWVHIAYERAGGTLSRYVNGVLAGTAVPSSEVFTGQTVKIGGSNQENTGYLTGYIDDLRITRGVARYGGPFTPPTEPHPTSAGGGSDGFRFWRIVNINVTDSSYLEISELQFLFGGAVQTGTMTSSDAPTGGGSLNNLNDQSTSTRVYWVKSAVIQPSFWIKMEFASPVPINGIRQGGFDNSSRHMAGFEVQYSDDDDDWTTLTTFSGLTYPGNYTLSSIYTLDPLPSTGEGDALFSNVELLLTANAYTSPIGVVARRPDRLATFDPDWPVKYKVGRRTEHLNRITFGGKGRINGTVKVSGTPNEPVRRRVRLFEERGGIFVADTFSDATTGAYEFIGLDENLRFTVVAYDYAENYRAVIADGVVPEVVT